MSEEAVRTRPYVHLLEGRDPLELLRTMPTRIARVLDSMATEAIETKTAPGKWSVREILCHLADCEIAWGWRFRTTYGESNPQLQPFDQDSWARAYQGSGYTVSSARATWTALRQWNITLLNELSPAERRRPATHAELGPLTLWTLVEIAAGHDLHHLAGLEKLAFQQNS